ncbi:mariner Mos1 transposase [Trichonephila clavipes]|nr:mariner Mos1 transposase [Trichonephila clavipes]
MRDSNAKPFDSSGSFGNPNLDSSSPHQDAPGDLFLGAPTPARSTGVTVCEYYGHPALSGNVIITPKVRFQILTPYSKMHTGLTFDAPSHMYLESLEIMKIRTWDMNVKSFHLILFLGGGHLGHPALSGKISGTSKIRLRILVYHPEVQQKGAFHASRLLGLAPTTTTCVKYGHLELSGKVTVISRIGYQIQIVHFKISQRPSFRFLRLLRRYVVFHQDNAPPHTSVVTCQKLWELDGEVLMYPPYSPDLTPNEYHHFLALQNFQSDKKFGSIEDCENRLLEFFANKGQEFYERGNMKLPLKWQQIIKQKGTYLTQIGHSETC